MKRNPKLTLVRRWLNLARADLSVAENSLGLKLDPTYTTICFHAQQCAEKAIKAILVYHEIDFPKTHDIALIMKLAKPHLDLEAILPDPDLLTP